MHFGEKPFQCITCRRSFTTSDLLIYHQGTHSGEVSFDCKSCQNWTSQKNESIQTWTMLHSLGLQSAYVDSQKLGVLKMDVLEVQFDSRNLDVWFVLRLSKDHILWEDVRFLCILVKSHFSA